MINSQRTREYIKYNHPITYIDIDALLTVKGDTDLVGAYLKEQKETQRRIVYNWTYRQEHGVMLLEGIAPTEAALISKLDLYKAKDYNEKIKKCEEKIISDMLPNDGREYFRRKPCC